MIQIIFLLILDGILLPYTSRSFRIEDNDLFSFSFTNEIIMSKSISLITLFCPTSSPVKSSFRWQGLLGKVTQIHRNTKNNQTQVC